MKKLEKKRVKAELKKQKKEIKSNKNKIVLKQYSEDSSTAVKFAEGIKGIIYLIFSISLIIAIILGQTGVIITLEDIIDSLILALAGKIVLIVISASLLIYGLKHLRLMK